MSAHDRQGRRAAAGLLVVHPGALGDVLTMFPLLGALGRRHGPVTLVCRPSAGYLAKTFHLAHRWISQDAGCWASLYTDRPDDGALRLLNGHRRILLFSVGGDIESRIRRLTPVPCLRIRPRPPAHVAEHVTAFAAGKLLSEGLLRRSPSLRRAACRQPETAAPRPFGRRAAPTLLHPGAGSPRKRWPLESFSEVAAKIEAAGGIPQIIIGPAEKDLLADPSIRGREVHVPERIEDLLGLLRSCAAFVGNDSGVAHLAACLGLPTTVVFTASDARRWRPNGPRVAALSPDLPCRPCFETRAENCPEPECLRAVTPEAVMRAHERLCREHRTA